MWLAQLSELENNGTVPRTHLNAHCMLAYSCYHYYFDGYIPIYSLCAVLSRSVVSHSLRPHGLNAAAAKSFQSCPTLCDRIDGSPPGPAVPGILQARTLEWVAISSSNA